MSPFTSNHVKLIKDCYPPKPEAGGAGGGGGQPSLPSAVSNNLGKLTFYAAGRPKKLPKLATALLERAERDSSKYGANKSARASLAVTIDIFRGLVVECRSELRCFVEAALRVVEIGLTTRSKDQRDPEMEARAASLVRERQN
jgi:hypothetical protein